MKSMERALESQQRHIEQLENAVERLEKSNEAEGKMKIYSTHVSLWKQIALLVALAWLLVMVLFF